MSYRAACNCVNCVIVSPSSGSDANCFLCDRYLLYSKLNLYLIFTMYQIGNYNYVWRLSNKILKCSPFLQRSLLLLFILPYQRLTKLLWNITQTHPVKWINRQEWHYKDHSRAPKTMTQTVQVNDRLAGGIPCFASVWIADSWRCE